MTSAASTEVEGPQRKPRRKLVIFLLMIAVYVVGFGPVTAGWVCFRKIDPTIIGKWDNAVLWLFYPHHRVAASCEAYFTYYRWWLGIADGSLNEFKYSEYCEAV